MTRLLIIGVSSDCAPRRLTAASLLSPVQGVLSDGGRPGLDDRDATVPEKLFLQNGNGFWAMPAHASDAVDVAYTMQGCVKGMGESLRLRAEAHGGPRVWTEGGPLAQPH